MKTSRRAYIHIGRIMSPFALVGLKLYTTITRRPRVRIVAVNEHDEILLVRGIISHLGWWTLPGGGVNRREKLEHAAARELHEETGIKQPADAFHYLRTIEKPELGLAFRAPLFYVSVEKRALPRRLYNPSEIADIGWFKLDEVPELTAAIVFAGIDEYRSQTR